MDNLHANQNIEDAEYWNTRWDKGDTGWDLGKISPPIKNYIDGLSDKSLRILIPGCGNAYEAEYLLSKGFHDITLIEISTTACSILNEKFEGNDKVKIINQDFFQFQGQYNLIIEQTFFCAINPILRNRYVQHSAELLSPNGNLVGLLFSSHFESDGPPFGGTLEEYQILFAPYFNIDTMELATQSVTPRNGNELFIILNKRNTNE